MPKRDGCRTKIQYPTKAFAKAALGAIRSKTQRNLSKGIFKIPPRRYYRCSSCKQWHLTSMRNKGTP